MHTLKFSVFLNYNLLNYRLFYPFLFTWIYIINMTIKCKTEHKVDHKVVQIWQSHVSPYVFHVFRFLLTHLIFLYSFSFSSFFFFLWFFFFSSFIQLTWHVVMLFDPFVALNIQYVVCKEMQMLCPCNLHERRLVTDHIGHWKKERIYILSLSLMLNAPSICPLVILIWTTTIWHAFFNAPAPAPSLPRLVFGPYTRYTKVYIII